MKKFHFVLASAAIFALAASPLFACDEHSKASKTANKGDATADAAVASNTGHACCAGKKAANGAACAMKGKAQCDHKTAKSSCPMGDSDMKKSAISLSGHVLCAKHDLKISDVCRPMFQADGSKDALPLCPDTDVDAVQKASHDGKTLLDVKGFMCENKKGEKMLMVSTFTARS